MSNYTDMAQAIKDVLSTIEGIGVIHIKYPDINNLSDLKELTVTNVDGGDTINAWFIQRSAISQDRSTAALTQAYRTHTFEIRGFYRFSDERDSEVTWQDLLDTIVDGLITQMTYSSVAEYSEMAQVTDIGYAELGPVLCHTGTIRIVLWERKSGLVYT